VSARVRPGKRIIIVDVSARGALVEASHRLLPGIAVDLQLETAHRHITVRGRVLRCHVARLRASSVSYRGAILFDCDLPWLVDAECDGYSVHAPESHPGPSIGEQATRQDV